MRTPLLWLLITWPAQALQCHECSATKDCFQPVSCAAQTRYCLTTWNRPPGQATIVIKSCAYTCPGFQESLLYSRASCCNTDLCNSAVSHSVSWGVLGFGILAAYLSR